MVAVQVMGNDTAISVAASQGNFQLNVFLPVSAYNFLLSTRLLTDVMDSFRIHCVDGVTANEERMEANLRNSLMLVTCLTPQIGYDACGRVRQEGAARRNYSAGSRPVSRLSEWGRFRCRRPS